MTELEPELVDRAARGDKRAFKALYDHYIGFIWKSMFVMTHGDQNLAGEIVQDTFIKVHRSLKKFRGDAQLSTWLYRIAYSSALNRLKKRKIELDRVASDEDLPGASEAAVNVENREMVSLVLKHLSARDRFLLVAREVNGFSFDALAEITGMNTGALRTRIHRIKHALRREFVDA